MYDKSCRQYNMTKIFLIVTCKISNSFDFFFSLLLMFGEQKYVSYE